MIFLSFIGNNSYEEYTDLYHAAAPLRATIPIYLSKYCDARIYQLFMLMTRITFTRILAKRGFLK